jgi:hypothetical protein
MTSAKIFSQDFETAAPSMKVASNCEVVDVRWDGGCRGQKFI